jgi:hypothetical protein
MNITVVGLNKIMWMDRAHTLTIKNRKYKDFGNKISCNEFL